MKIISTTDLSHYGNDCYINHSISFVKQFGVYAVIALLRVTGWYENNRGEMLYVGDDYGKAIQIYQMHGGIMKDETLD